MKTEKRKLEKVSKKVNYEAMYDLFSEVTENVNSLISESKLLLDNGFFARSYTLSMTALEELGKRTLVADYINDLVSEQEFKTGFNSHEFKLAYLRNNIKILEDEKGKVMWEIVYDTKGHKKYINERHNSLYVNYRDNKTINPLKHITKEDAVYLNTYLINMVKKINFAEELNGRIGSKAIFK
ncbi:MAG: AbiV family abortive infection protein [Clostridiales bacterium]|jgi:AbiV family abortive infection protein|nr:AbiV family abortive infection protein [Clostridiales bacterium]